MNEPLKKILYKWSTGEMSLDDAEAELRECLVSIAPVAILSTPHRLSAIQVQAINEQWSHVFKGTCKAIVLQDGMTIQNGVGFVPESLKARIGAFEVSTDCNCSCMWNATIDGNALPAMTKMEIVLEVGCHPHISCEFVALPVSAKECRA